jgi:hypothetical protein
VKVATPTVKPPGAPTAVSAVPVNGAPTALRISWTAPASVGGSAIVFEYTATAYASPAGASPVRTCKPVGELKTCDIGGLSPATEYLVDVVATNAAGNSPASARVKAVTPNVTNRQLAAVSGVRVVKPSVRWNPAPGVQGLQNRYTATLTNTRTNQQFTCVATLPACSPRGFPWSGQGGGQVTMSEQYAVVVTYEVVGTTLRSPAHSPVRFWS